MEKVMKLGLEKEEGVLYYVGKDGNLWGFKSMGRVKGGKSNHVQVAQLNLEKEKGFLYVLDKDGDISKAKMKHAKE